MDKYLVYNGISSRDYGVWISGSGTYNKPMRRVEKYTIPGRSGALVVDENAFENVTVAYPAFIARGFESRFNDFMAAMYSANGYARLEDNYDNDHYRLAVFNGAIEPEVGTLNRSGRFTLEFDCMPQRWFREDAKVQVYGYGSENSNGTKIIPKSFYTAKPQIFIQKYSSAVSNPLPGATIMEYLMKQMPDNGFAQTGFYGFRISSEYPYESLYVDCENEEFYYIDNNGRNINVSNYILGNALSGENRLPFFSIKGHREIAYASFVEGNASGGDRNVQIFVTPHWWEI